jgi:glycosyltransferase involved in cell wall biosynthesis
MEELDLRLRADGVRTIAVSNRCPGWVRGADMVLTTWRRRRDFDLAIVDLFSGRAFLWGEAVCGLLRRFRKPHLVVLRGGGLPGFARGRERRVRRLLEGATVVAAPSRYLQEQMKTYRSDIELLPNALDLGSYAFRPRELAHPRLVWLRAFHRIYNPLLAPRVVALLAEKFPDVSLVMVGRDKGDGSLQETQELAQRLGVTARVSFPGGVSKAAVPGWLNRGDIFLNTTDVDNTPVSVLEAMACGMCVVSTDVGGLPYLLEDGRTALLVPPDDPIAMAGAVRRLLERPELSERLSRSARQAAEAFQWGEILPNWEALLREVAHSRAGVPEGSRATEASHDGRFDGLYRRIRRSSSGAEPMGGSRKEFGRRANGPGDSAPL